MRLPKFLTRERPAPYRDNTALGNILLRMGVITSDQLIEAVSVQMETERLLGEILVTLGSCSRIQLEAAITKQKELRKGHVDYATQGDKLVNLVIERHHRTAAAIDEVTQAAQRVAKKEEK